MIVFLVSYRDSLNFHLKSDNVRHAEYLRAR